AQVAGHQDGDERRVRDLHRPGDGPAIRFAQHALLHREPAAARETFASLRGTGETPVTETAAGRRGSRRGPSILPGRRRAPARPGLDSLHSVSYSGARETWEG